MRIFYFFTALILSQYSYGQWFNNITTFTTQNGLSNNAITCLQKDSAGFLWIGTHEGLNRYDGTEFINVLSNEKNNLPSNNINKIFFISKTLMAVATDAGLCLLNTATLSGKRIELPFNEKFSNTAYYINDLFYKKTTHELWACTWHGIFVLNNEGKLLRKMMASETDMGKGFFARYLFTDEHNDIYFFSQQKNGFYYPDFIKQELIPAEKNIPGFALNGFIKNKYSLMSAQTLGPESVCVFSKSNLTVNEEYLSYYNTATGRNFIDKISVNFNDQKRIFNAFPLNDSIFLVNSFFGEPLLYNTNSHEIKAAADHPLWFTSWPDGLGASLYKDENNIWIATSKGLLQSSVKNDFFKTNHTLTDIVKTNSGLVSYNYGIYDSGRFWTACMGAGLYSLDTANNAVQVLFDQNTPPEFRPKIVSTEVFAAGKSLWLFSVYGPVQVNAETKKLSLVAGTDKDVDFDNKAGYPMKDSKGNIWVTLGVGIEMPKINHNADIH
ncbi:MAG TPA: two-component regulator propeller domain-containing protein [Panacibacter sp.]|nr:two-component regulator propeller domain-containing protein [Panacibacter sp.]